MNSKFYITFAFVWTFTEALLNLSGVKDLNAWILRSLLASIFIISFIVQVVHHLKHKKGYYRGPKLIKRVKHSILNGLSYLEKENANKYGQRLRLTPSIMESSTVVGAIYMAAKTLNREPRISIQIVNWLFSALKKQFQERVAVKHFDCSRCNGGQICNAAYFDYTSHFYYAKGTELYDHFCKEFSFLSEVLKSRIIAVNGQMGWPIFFENVIDPLSTATNLILHSLFPCLSPDQEKAVTRTLVGLQVREGSKIGSWQRTIDNEKICTGEMPIITAHRVVEALRLFLGKHEEIDNDILESISRATRFLKSSPGAEAPVSYEYRMGIDDEEVLRGTGHIIQALVKANDIDVFTEKQINYLINLQHRDGSFIGRSEAFREDRALTNLTDLTAFITRTLCIFYEERTNYLSKIKNKIETSIE